MYLPEVSVSSSMVEYDITNKEPARFFEKIIRIWIIDKIIYPLIFDDNKY